MRHEDSTFEIGFGQYVRKRSGMIDVETLNEMLATSCRKRLIAYLTAHTQAQGLGNLCTVLFAVRRSQNQSMHLVRVVLILVYMIFCKDRRARKEKTTRKDSPMEEPRTIVA
jgi:hypothetical protein